MTRVPIVALVLAVAVGAVLTHHRANRSADVDGTGSLRSEAPSLLHEDDLLVVTPDASSEWGEALLDAYRALFAGLAGDQRPARVLPADRVTDGDLRDRSIALVGSPRTNRFVRSALARFPVFVGEKTIRFLDENARLGHPYGRFRNVDRFVNVSLRGANPWSPRHGLLLFTGCSDSPLLEYRDNLDPPYDYRLRLRDIELRSGRFSSAPGGPFLPDPETDRNFLPEDAYSDYRRSLRFRRAGPAQNDPEKSLYYIGVPPSITNDQRIQRAMENRASRVREVFSSITEEMKEPRLRMYLYPDAVTKALQTGDFAHTHGSTLGLQIHAIFDDRFSAADISAEMTIARDQLYSKLRIPAIRDGFPYAAAEHFRGERLASVLSRLYRAGILPSAGELLDGERFARLSPRIGLPAAAGLVRYLWSTRAIEADPRRGLSLALILGHFDGPPADAVERVLETDLEGLDREWRAWVHALAHSPDPGAPGGDTPARKRALGPERHAGVVFEHTWRVATGLGSNEAGLALDQAAEEIGARFVSVRPLARLARSDAPELLDFPHPEGRLAAGLPDGAIEAFFRNAKNRGLGILLVPHLQVPGGGGVALESPQAWNAFFEQYRQFVLHHALLAERSGADALCVGSGIGREATRRFRPIDSLVQEIRRVYRGPIVFAAGSLDDLAVLRIQHRFDAVGIEVDLPCESGRDGASRRRLRAAVDRIVRRLESISQRFRKPVLISALRVRDCPDDEAGARSVRVALEALSAKSWFAGAYWWRYFSDRSWNRRTVLGVPPASAATRAALERAFQEFR